MHGHGLDGRTSGCVVCAAAADEDGWRGTEAGGARLSRGTLLRRGAIAGLALGAAGALSASASAAAPRYAPHAGLGHGRRPLVLEPSWVLVHENGGQQLKRDHHVVVENGAIAAIGEGRRRGRDRRLTAIGELLLPGFISGHTHVAGGTVTRGIIEGGRSFARPLVVADELSDEELDDLTAFNLAELLLGGCTTQLEMALSLKQARSYVRVAERLGTRGYVGGMVPGIHRLFPIWFRGTNDQVLFESEAGTLQEIADNLAFGLAVNGSQDGRILAQPTPHATDTQTPATMQAFAAAAARLGNGIHLHLSQSANETATVQRLWGKRPVEWLDDFGFYDGPLFGAHMSGIDLAGDPPILRDKGATYAHCPSAGGAGGGTQPWPEILSQGVNTSIGIDTHSNDYAENLKLAVLYGQARRSLLPPAGPGLPPQTGSPPVAVENPTVWDAVEAATINAAIGLRRDDLGRIEVGAKADLVTVDVTGFLTGTGAVPPEPLNNLLYGHGLAVRTVLTDGRVQVLGGRLVVGSERRIRERGGAAVQAVWDRLADEGFFTPTPR
ncbi:MAG: amidohydrolase family protein [Thermoleophilia bacterium]